MYIPIIRIHVIKGGIFEHPQYKEFLERPVGTYLGAGNSKILGEFSPRKLGKMIQFDEHIFQMGGEKPPTRKVLLMVQKSSQPVTLPETNIAPARKPSQKETRLPTIHFQVLR